MREEIIDENDERRRENGIFLEFRKLMFEFALGIYDCFKLDYLYFLCRY